MVNDCGRLFFYTKTLAMKKTLTVFALLISFCSHSQFSVSSGAGISTRGIFYAHLDIGAEYNKMSSYVGFTRNMAKETIPEYLYFKQGYAFKVNERMSFAAFAGAGVEYYLTEVSKGTDPIYSHYERIAFVKPVYGAEVRFCYFNNSHLSSRVIVIGDNSIFSVSLTCIF